jgi:hypothetical protein
MGKPHRSGLKRDRASRGSSPRGWDDGGEAENGQRQCLAAVTLCPHREGIPEHGNVMLGALMGAGEDGCADGRLL